MGVMTHITISPLMLVGGIILILFFGSFMFLMARSIVGKMVGSTSGLVLSGMLVWAYIKGKEVEAN